MPKSRGWGAMVSAPTEIPMTRNKVTWIGDISHAGEQDTTRPDYNNKLYQFIIIN